MRHRLTACVAVASVVLGVLAAQPWSASAREITAEVVSRTPGGTVAAGVSDWPSVNSDGSLVAFSSNAAALVTTNPTNPWYPYRAIPQVWLKDRRTGALDLVSRSRFGLPGDFASAEPDITPSGRHVAFSSQATTLTAGTQTRDYRVYLRDLTTRTTALVATGCVTPSVSDDGRFVAMRCSSPTTWVITVHDMVTGGDVQVSAPAGVAPNGESLDPTISADGRYVSFLSFATNLVNAQDDNSTADAFVFDRESGVTTLASRLPSGETPLGVGDVTLSGDGRTVAFTSRDSRFNGTDEGRIRLYDVQTGTVSTLPVAGREPVGLSFDATGSRLSFTSADTNHAAFVHDRVTGRTAQVAPPAAGRVPNQTTLRTALSADGSSVAFAGRTAATTGSVWAAATAAPPPATPARFTSTTPTRAASALPLGPGGSVVVDLSSIVPAGTTAVAVNLTVAGISSPTYVSLCSASIPATECAGTSSINVYPGIDRANAAVPGVGSDRTLRIYNNAGTVLAFLDVLGWFSPQASASDYVAVTQTRDDEVLTLGAGARRTVTLADRPVGATAAVVRITAAGVTDNTFLSACPVTVTTGRCAGSSTLNTRGQDTSNLAIVPIDAQGRFDVYNNRGSVIVYTDLQGWFAPAGTGARYVAVEPTRVEEFRSTGSGRVDSSAYPLVPTDATAVVANATLAAPTQLSYFSMCQAGRPSAECVSTSTINPYPGQDTAATTITSLGEGSWIAWYNNAGDAKLFVDVQGWFVP